MLRKDGTFNIFQIQVLYKDGKTWCDGTGMPENSIGSNEKGAINIKGLKHKNDGGYSGTCAKEYREFTACGDCWQETGIFGTYDLNVAIKLMSEVSKNNLGNTFRIILLTASKSVTEISRICIPNKKRKNNE